MEEKNSALITSSREGTMSCGLAVWEVKTIKGVLCHLSPEAAEEHPYSRYVTVFSLFSTENNYRYVFPVAPILAALVHKFPHS